MSFRTRLTGFFVLIVVVPMIALAVLVFRLISDSQNGKADARASGLASAAASLYRSETASGTVDAETIARELAAGGRGLIANLGAVSARSGLARVIGMWGLAAGIVNVTIGGGIFRLPAGVAAAVGPAAPLASLPLSGP